jgi:hypothetical protein
MGRWARQKPLNDLKVIAYPYRMSNDAFRIDQLGVSHGQARYDLTFS